MELPTHIPLGSLSSNILRTLLIDERTSRLHGCLGFPDLVSSIGWISLWRRVWSFNRSLRRFFFDIVFL